MKASWYAEALYEALTEKNVKTEADAHKVFTRFRKVLALRGHEKLLPFVVHELEKIAVREKNNNQVLLVTADKKSQTKWSHAYDHYKKEGVVPKGAALQELVDESIVGGYQIRTKDTLIDASYKKSLLELYRKITN
jgi:F0F1-type ATP synthase delta subunit